MYRSIGIAICIIIAGLFTLAEAQPPTLWTQTYGGGQSDEGHDVIQAMDGTFVVTGFTFSSGAGLADVYLLNLDVSGGVLWETTFGGTFYDRGNALEQTWDGGYIVAGETKSMGSGEEDFYLLKIDQLGGLTWQQAYGSAEEDVAYDVQQTSDGGYIMVGTTYANWGYGTDIYLIKVDASGVEEWSQSIGGEDDEEAYGIEQTPDDGFIIAGYSNSYLPYGTNLFKTDAMGNLEWMQSYGGGISGATREVALTQDGGFIVVGSKAEVGGTNRDIFLVRTDANGDSLWTRQYGGIHNDDGYDVKETTDGGFIITGSALPDSVYNDEDFYIMKTDEGGNMLWDLRFGTGEGYHSFGYGIAQTMDGGYIAVGKTDPVSSLQYDLFLIRLDQDTAVLPGTNQHPSNFVLHPPYPNPFNPTTVISFDLPVASEVRLEVYDINGCQCLWGSGTTPTTGIYTAGAHQVEFDGSGLASGIYLYRLEMSGSGATPTIGFGKMVLLK